MAAHRAVTTTRGVQLIRSFPLAHPFGLDSFTPVQSACRLSHLCRGFPAMLHSRPMSSAPANSFVEAGRFGLSNEQIVSPLGGHWDDRLLCDRNYGQAGHSERAILQLLRSYDFLRHGGGDLN